MAQNYLRISGVTGQKGNDRQYKVHVPPSYSSTTPMPVLFCMHGLFQNAVMFCLDSGVAWNIKSDAKGFILVMPNGYQNSWNGGTCCGAAATNGLDDVSLMRAIFAEVAAHLNVDPHRVYATGLSNGGYLSYRLACEASDIFVAIAPSAGAVGTVAIGGGVDGGLPVINSTSDLTSCAPTHPVSVLDIHGTDDPLVAYGVQAPSLAIFNAADGCSARSTPASVPISGGDTSCVTYGGCPACPGIEVTGCSVQGGGHCWFGSSDCGTGGGTLGNAFVGNNSTFMKNTDAIWAFLSRFSR
jgi:polyhydroxybutyrate depolymerase